MINLIHELRVGQMYFQFSSQYLTYKICDCVICVIAKLHGYLRISHIGAFGVSDLDVSVPNFWTVVACLQPRIG